MFSKKKKKKTNETGLISVNTKEYNTYVAWLAWT